MREISTEDTGREGERRAYGWLFLELFAMFGLGAEVCEDTVVGGWAGAAAVDSDWCSERARRSSW